MSDMLTGQPVYRPSGDVARSIARDWIYQHVKRLMERDNIKVSLGEMNDDGVCEIHVHAETTEFDIRTMMDWPTITGAVWIEDRASAPVHIWYSFPAQEHTAAETNYADTPPVDFWMRYRKE